ncbi:serine/arginine repetitive matrix protein 1-like [Indicator indicator]|uniref:serine/arginine repetitive matrix protein 1-like n=1 Tax=Indicator indicator TaxID=1002788 RepID=UPI0023DF801F|nr:serine/arginine repetitive matrix protein 1-like [Indicator indicator]
MGGHARRPEPKPSRGRAEAPPHHRTRLPHRTEFKRPERARARARLPARAGGSGEGGANGNIRVPAAPRRRCGPGPPPPPRVKRREGEKRAGGGRHGHTNETTTPDTPRLTPPPLNGARRRVFGFDGVGARLPGRRPFPTNNGGVLSGRGGGAAAAASRASPLTERSPLPGQRTPPSPPRFGELGTRPPSIVSRPFVTATAEKRAAEGDATLSRKRGKKSRRGTPLLKYPQMSVDPQRLPLTLTPILIPLCCSTAAHLTERRSPTGPPPCPAPSQAPEGLRTPQYRPQPRRAPTFPLRRSSHTPLPPAPPRTKAPNNGT